MVKFEKVLVAEDELAASVVEARKLDSKSHNRP